MEFNEKEKRARFEQLDEMRRELIRQLDAVANEMIQIWKEYDEHLHSRGVKDGSH